jgi:hypothetical protein
MGRVALVFWWISLNPFAPPPAPGMTTMAGPAGTVMIVGGLHIEGVRFFETAEACRKARDERIAEHKADFVLLAGCGSNEATGILLDYYRPGEGLSIAPPNPSGLLPYDAAPADKVVK